MSNALALEELRREGYIPWSVDRRDRIVNACGEDVQQHIDKYLKGYSLPRMRKNKETGNAEIVEKKFPPNPYLATLLLKYEFYLYSFVLRKFTKTDGKRSKMSVYECRKWQAILSPEGQVSFALEENEEKS